MATTCFEVPETVDLRCQPKLELRTTCLFVQWDQWMFVDIPSCFLFLGTTNLPKQKQQFLLSSSTTIPLFPKTTTTTTSTRQAHLMSLRLHMYIPGMFADSACHVLPGSFSWMWFGGSSHAATFKPPMSWGEKEEGGTVIQHSGGNSSTKKGPPPKINMSATKGIIFIRK